VDETAPPPVQPLPSTRWRVARETRTHGTASVTRTLLDSPFYARSVLSTEMMGEPAVAMHESLALDRFAAPWVQAMLPFRVPRW
jgi:carotenoid 1,2-hydratase